MSWQSSPAEDKYICEVGVLMASEILMRAGFNVAKPVIDEGYDLLAIDGRCHWRIQVKATAGRQARNRIRIMKGARKQAYYHPDEIDAIMAINVKTGQVVCIPYSKTKGKRWLAFKANEHYDDPAILRGIPLKSPTEKLKRTRGLGRPSGARTHDPLPEGIVTTVGKPAASNRAKSRGLQ